MLSGAAAVMPRWAQATANVRVSTRDLPQTVREAVDRLNRELQGTGRVLVRPSGTEPLMRILAEAQNEAVAQNACASLASLLQQELG